MSRYNSSKSQADGMLKKELEQSTTTRDAPPPTTTIDKMSSYESGHTDSGFLSGAIHSEHSIISSLDDLSSATNIQSGNTALYSKQSSCCTDSGFLDVDSRKLDSGVIDQLNDLSLDKASQNDLNAPRGSSGSVDPAASKSQQIPTQVYEPWLEYFLQDEDGDTQLHIAIIQGFIEVVFGLIRLAPHPCFLDVPNNCHQTPLHLAVLTAQGPIVRALLVAGASPIAKDAQGNTPLHLAAIQGDPECARALLSPISVNDTASLGLRYQVPPSPPCCAVDLPNYDGENCVHLAAAGPLKGHVEVLRHLIWAGANINAREGKAGRTALHIAAERGRRGAANLLMTTPGDYGMKVDLSALTFAGFTPYELACYSDPLLAKTLQQAGARTRGSRDSSSESDSDEDEGQVEVVGRYPPEGFIRSGLVVA